MAAVALGACLLAALWAAGLVQFPVLEALFASEASVDAPVSVESPPAGATLLPGTVIRGAVDGAGEVRLWVEGVHLAVPVERFGSEWQYTYPGGLSGERTLAIALVNGDTWSQAVKVTYRFDAVEADAPSSGLWRIFAPVERFFQGAVTVLTGRGSGDLDQNGVADRWQGGFASPASGAWARVPYLTTAATALVVVLVAGMAAYAWRAPQLHAFLLQRAERRRRTKAEQERTQRARLRVLERAAARQLATRERAYHHRLRAVLALQRDRLRTIRAQRKPRG